jgi:tetratricopeptide (TPR) repeat protein
LPADDDEALDALAQQFMAALTARDEGRVDDAEEDLRAILKTEPRLPEPRLELARVLLDTDRIEEAEAQAREALADLEKSGPWTEQLEPDVVMALGKALLAEVLRRRADEDDVVFGDPGRFNALVKESQALFAEASRLDPSDEYASYHAFFLGMRGHGGEEPREDDA